MANRLTTIVAALTLSCAAWATANAGPSKLKRVDRNKVVRAQLKKAKAKKKRNANKFDVVVPDDPSVRAIHIISPSGKLLTVPTDAIEFGGKVSAQTTSQCGGNQELWTRWNAIDRCCREDGQQRCVATQKCKQDVSTCVGPDGVAYTATGVPYACTPCPAANSGDALVSLPATF